MKRCPTCKRTYADDGFTFCLDDGALLSAPYDPKDEKPISTMRSSGPPPTVTLPAQQPSERTSEPARNEPLPPTIASPSKSPDPAPAKPFVPPRFAPEVPPGKSSRLPYIVISVLILIIVLGGISMYGVARSQCPDVVVNCSSFDNLTYCALNLRDPQGPTGTDNRPISDALCSLRPVLGLQTAPVPARVTSLNWSASSGKPLSQGNQLTLDTTGLAGQAITVKATFTSSNWFCSNTSSTSFIAPASTRPK